MRLFEREIKIREEFNKMDLKELEVYFKKLDFNIQLNILIKWFGSNPLFNEMIEKENGIKHLKDNLIELKEKGVF